MARTSNEWLAIEGEVTRKIQAAHPEWSGGRILEHVGREMREMRDRAHRQKDEVLDGLPQSEPDAQTATQVKKNRTKKEPKPARKPKAGAAAKTRTKLGDKPVAKRKETNERAAEAKAGRVKNPDGKCGTYPSGVAKRADKRTGDNPCLCGCGRLVRKFFSQGHDARVRGWTLSILEGDTGAKVPTGALKAMRDGLVLKDIRMTPEAVAILEKAAR